MDFITIDFETATSARDSPCEIGLTFVKDKRIIETKSWLIKPIYYPEFDPFNTLIHGITREDVADKPEFNELWTEIQPLIENQFLIAHNARFDIDVLRKTLTTYQLPYPTLNYSCSYVFSRKIWQGLPAYDLATLCLINNININQHRAGADSRATAELTLKAFEAVGGVSSIDDFLEKINPTIAQLSVGNPIKHKTDNIFYGTTVVFTGALLSMTRSEAQQIIIDIGGIIGSGVTKVTDFLIVGEQDYRVVGDDGMSSKQEKAIKLIESGSTLEILSENDFLKNL